MSGNEQPGEGGSSESLVLRGCNVGKTESLTDLPTNILVEIFSRLPLTALFASRCTCKTFLHLISANSDFIPAASQLVILRFLGCHNIAVRLRLIEPESYFDPELEVNFLLNNDVSLPGWWPAHATDYTLSENVLDLTNSCNGLLLLATRAPLDYKISSLVCNPVTNEFVICPDALQHQEEIQSMWLGFCQRSNQYKVLSIFKSTLGGDMKAKVLVVGTRSWMDIDGVLGWFDYSRAASHALLDGVIYWFDRSGGNIVFFEFEAQKFGVKSLPHEFEEPHLHSELMKFACEDQVLRDKILGLNGSEWEEWLHNQWRTKEFGQQWLLNIILGYEFWVRKLGDEADGFEFEVENLREYMVLRMSLGVISGCLSLTHFDEVASYVDIWVMKRDGNQESWVKQFVIDNLGGQPDDRWRYYIRPLHVLRNGEILIDWFGVDLVCYNPITQSLRTVTKVLRPNEGYPTVLTLFPNFASLENTLKLDEHDIVKHMRLCRDDSVMNMIGLRWQPIGK